MGEAGGRSKYLKYPESIYSLSATAIFSRRVRSVNDTQNCGHYVPDIAKAAMNQCVAFIRLRLNHRTITTTRFDTTDTATEK